MVFMKPTIFLEDIVGTQNHSSLVRNQPEARPAGPAELLSLSLLNHAAFCRDGALLYYCINWRYFGDFTIAALKPTSTELCDLCVLVKDTAAEGSLYRNQHELVLVFRKTAGSDDATRPQLGNFARERSNVWHYPSVKPPVRSAKVSDPPDYRAGMPVDMVSEAILDATGVGDIVLDGCLGTGATLIAAERTQRRCFAIEYDPRCVDAVIRRWQKLTGDVARHAETGRSYDDIAVEAEVTDAA